MKKPLLKLLLVTVLIFHFGMSNCQNLDESRKVNWKLAGLFDTSQTNFQMINLDNIGFFNDGITANDLLMDSLLSLTFDNGVIFQFNTGNYLFQQPITLRSNMILKGNGATQTQLTFDTPVGSNGIQVLGTATSILTPIAEAAQKGATYLKVLNSADFLIGDWIKIIQNDSSFITSDWALGSVGQIIQIVDIHYDTLFLRSPLRLDYPLSLNPRVVKLEMKSNVGIECLKIVMGTNSTPIHTSNIVFQYVNNGWIHAVESQNGNFSHVDLRFSSNISINKSYLHHSFDYGEGGTGYGVMLHYATNECFIEDNLFEHLRHSMILQAGANGNVFAFNYSRDPFWTNSSGVLPSDAAGDMVLHGNYVYANLFEQNICQNIVIDNSHGANGPHNTFLRNRCEKYGVFFSDNTSPNQNIMGNEIVNSSFPYSLVNYTIQGSGHYLYGNNNKGTITPSGTNDLGDSTFAYLQRPDFVAANEWLKIGPPNSLNTITTNPAKTRFLNQQIFIHTCGDDTSVEDFTQRDKKIRWIQVSPNPSSGIFNLYVLQDIDYLYVVNPIGERMAIYSSLYKGDQSLIDLTHFPSGIYILVSVKGTNTVTQKLIKSN